MKLACAALAVTAGLLAPAPARAADTPQLLRPTGHHPVGTTALHLTDTSRTDPWVPGLTARELMVTVWYPAAAPGGTRARYMTPRESELYLAGKRLTDLPADTLSRVRTYAYVDARPAGRAHSLPLVVLSPGYTQPRGSLSGPAEDLASHGYVVVGIDHTHETYAVTFPGGRIATCATCELDEDDAFFRKLYAGRAADQLGIDLGATTTGARSQEITRRYHRAIFERHLRDRPQPLLDRPSPRYPEVVIAAR
ncbi:alpha/beta hydrolase [Actinoplanes auranticolor]|uniref:Platelet-activating factor acetylhydrolase n=1 Tax=Actinoplanes auranticolor TaxID=47988 RepID=A0A919SVY3_9ACTN|nr:hypothetical protein [Actinoplanes auranticolor]GIM78392.1 hypothetical protein Aau02nite_80610 [Actinoplanes auranticolor]